MASPEALSTRVIRSGTVAATWSPRQATENSFWKSIAMVWPRSASSPSMAMRPRSQPSVARRITSVILPRKRTMPPSAATTAAIGSAWASRAARTVRPIDSPRDSVCRQVARFTSAPVRGALQVAAEAPNTVQARLVIRSIHDQSSASVKRMRLRRMSTIVHG